MSQSSGFKFKGLTALAVVLIIVIAFFSNISNFIIDYQWFKELSYSEVFFKKLATQIQFFIPTFIVLFVLCFLYLKSINSHSIKQSGVILSTGEKKLRNRIFIGVAALVSLAFTIFFVTSIWYDFLVFINQSSFGIVDPIFNRDIGFFMFALPFLNKIYGFIMAILFVFAIIAVLYNMLMFATAKAPEIGEDNVRSFYSNPKDIYKSILGAASKQLMVLGGLFFLLLAFGFYLRAFDLLHSTNGIAYGASYADIHITLPSYYIYMGICVITAILLLVSRSLKNAKLAALGPVLLIVAMVGSGLISTGVQRFIVTPNELAKEEQYLQNNINYTNYAYGLDKVITKSFEVKQDLTRADIEKNRVTINNIPINDYRPAKDIYNQIQGLKNYYQFNDIDIDRYMIDGTYRQVFVSARELQSANIPKSSAGQSASWINRYLKFTHGYGVAMSPVNEVTSSGQPRLFLRDMPVVSEVDIKLDQPQIYFGELTKEFAIVNTREKEFDYPSSNANIETTYSGTGGIKLNFLNRLMFAAKEGQMNFLLSQDINSQSKILLNREIVKRAQKIAPFLLFDDDPYVVVANGKVYWIIDAYTISSRYPYAEPVNENTTTNYIRNSVKVVVDAYNGTTNFYVSDKNDPLINTYSKIFKTLFKPLESMDKNLQAHVRYPQMLFDIQSDLFRKYHMKTARELYNKSDIWDIATQISGMSGEKGTNQAVESAYLIMRLPETEAEEFLLMAPYTPQGKNNMIAWIGVKNDGADYGNLIQYDFPSGKIVEGPMQIEGIISQDTVIGPQLNLLATGGNSQVVRGNMMSIPIEDSLLYVEPIYIKAINANALPELKKVILFYKNRVLMEDNLETALNKIFPETEQPGKPPVKPETPAQTPSQPTTPGATGTVVELAKKANDIFIEAQNALKEGNWADYGKKMTELQEALNQLNTTAGNPGSTTP